jgi:hypothetical protein
MGFSALVRQAGFNPREAAGLFQILEPYRKKTALLVPNAGGMAQPARKPIFARPESAPDRTVILRAQTRGFCRPATTDMNKFSAQKNL